jgi:vitamin B12 transporter
LGAAQTVQIRGASSDKTAVYLDGVPLNSALYGYYDLNSIPISMIDHIEIIKSGAGNLARTNAIGGMVNIITKKGKTSEKPYTLSVENGSFLPLTYGTSNERNWASLADSQKLDLAYSDNLEGLGVSANLGGIVAQNAYTYETDTDRELRDNAGVMNVHGNITLDGVVGENIGFQSNNLASYQNLGVPGSTTYGLTPDDYQTDSLVSTSNALSFSNLDIEALENMKAVVNYTYNKTFFHTSYGDSTHNKHKAFMQAEQVWNLGENYSLTSGIDGTLDYIDSTDVGQHLRFMPSLYANAAIFFSGNRFSLYPSANLGYVSDKQVLSPNASLGAIYTLGESTELNTTISYAERVPTFSDLYWPYSGNSDLDTEKGLNGDLGIDYKKGPFSYEGSLFARNIYNAIIWAEQSDYSWIPENVGHSVYFGTEQGISWTVNALLFVQASYQYNKSFDLSDGQTLSDNVEVSSVRKHTAKASATYTQKRWGVVVSGEYLGKTTYSDSIVLLNMSVNAQVTDSLKTYLAIDNLLNTSYVLASGYPMPGTKIRLGGSWNF